MSQDSLPLTEKLTLGSQLFCALSWLGRRILNSNGKIMGTHLTEGVLISD